MSVDDNLLMLVYSSDGINILKAGEILFFAAGGHPNIPKSSVLSLLEK